MILQQQTYLWAFSECVCLGCGCWCGYLSTRLLEGIKDPCASSGKGGMTKSEEPNHSPDFYKSWLQIEGPNCSHQLSSDLHSVADHYSDWILPTSSHQSSLDKIKIVISWIISCIIVFCICLSVYLQNYLFFLFGDLGGLLKGKQWQEKKKSKGDHRSARKVAVKALIQSLLWRNYDTNNPLTLWELTNSWLTLHSQSTVFFYRGPNVFFCAFLQQYPTTPIYSIKQKVSNYLCFYSFKRKPCGLTGLWYRIWGCKSPGDSFKSTVSEYGRCAFLLGVLILHSIYTAPLNCFI